MDTIAIVYNAFIIIALCKNIVNRENEIMKKRLLILCLMMVLIFVDITNIRPLCEEQMPAAPATAQAASTTAQAAPAEDPTVSSEAYKYAAMNITTPFTPEQYVMYMNMDPLFNLKAYMYYNEDLMSAYTYNYWMYYKHYIEKGMFEGRPHLFFPDDPYNTVTLGRYSTQYNAKIQRAVNVSLACQYMNGTVVMPGEIFSFNNAVGPRTAARGFKIAHVYVNKEVVDGMGGGICQVSSTLYTSMMIAGIPALERHVHCLPVSYLMPNLDATVCWNSLDLRFINPFDFPIVLFAEADNGTCTVSIVKYPTENTVSNGR